MEANKKMDYLKESSTMDRVTEIFTIRDQEYQRREEMLKRQKDELQLLFDQISQKQKELEVKSKEMEEQEKIIQEHQMLLDEKKKEFSDRERKILLRENELIKQKSDLEGKLSEQLTAVQLEYEAAKNESLKISREREELEIMQQNLKLGKPVSSGEIERLKDELQGKIQELVQIKEEKDELELQLHKLEELKNDITSKYIELKKKMAEGQYETDQEALQQELEEKNRKIAELEEMIQRGENNSSLRSLSAGEVRKVLERIESVQNVTILHGKNFDTVQGQIDMKMVYVCLDDPCFIQIKAARGRKVKSAALADMNSGYPNIKFYVDDNNGVSADKYISREISPERLEQEIRSVINCFEN